VHWKGLLSIIPVLFKFNLPKKEVQGDQQLNLFLLREYNLQGKQ